MFFNPIEHRRKSGHSHLGPILIIGMLAAVISAQRATAQQATIDDVVPAIVRIVSQSCEPRCQDAGVGSGVVIHPSGIILTAWHVTVQDENNLLNPSYWQDFVIEVSNDYRLAPSPRYRAQIIAAKPEMDLALLRIYQDLQSGESIDATNELALPSLPLAEDKQLTLGQEVKILGFPFISPTRPTTIDYTESNLSGVEDSGALLRVRTSLSRGNSGGPALIESEGRFFVVGIVIRRRGELGEQGLLRSVNALHDMSWLPNTRRVWVDHLQMTADFSEDEPALKLTLTMHALDFANRPASLLAYLFDAQSGQPWRAGTKNVDRTTSGQIFLQHEIQVQRFTGEEKILLSVLLSDLKATPENVKVYLMIWDGKDGRSVWKGQPTLVVHSDTREQTPMLSANYTPTPTYMFTPTATPTATPTWTVTSTHTSTSVPTSTATDTPSETPTPEVPQARAITNVNVRSGPGTQYAIVNEMLSGQTASIVGGNRLVDWWQILMSNGSIGWVYSPLVEIIGSTDDVRTVSVPDVPTLASTVIATSPTSLPTPTRQVEDRAYGSIRLIGPANGAFMDQGTVTLDWSHENGLALGYHYVVVVSHLQGDNWAVTDRVFWHMESWLHPLQPPGGFEWWIGVCRGAEIGQYASNPCDELPLRSELRNFHWSRTASPLPTPDFARE